MSIVAALGSILHLKPEASLPIAVMSTCLRTQATLVGKRPIYAYLWAGWRGRRPVSTLGRYCQRSRLRAMMSLPQAWWGQYADSHQCLYCCCRTSWGYCGGKASSCSNEASLKWSGETTARHRFPRSPQSSGLPQRKHHKRSKMTILWPISTSTLVSASMSWGTQGRFSWRGTWLHFLLPHLAYFCHRLPLDLPSSTTFWPWVSVAAVVQFEVLPRASPQPIWSASWTHWRDPTTQKDNLFTTMQREMVRRKQLTCKRFTSRWSPKMKSFMLPQSRQFFLCSSGVEGRFDPDFSLWIAAARGSLESHCWGSATGCFCSPRFSYGLALFCCFCCCWSSTTTGVLMFFLEMRTTRVRLPLTTAVPLPGMTIWFLGRTTDVSPTAFELETIGGLNMV